MRPAVSPLSSYTNHLRTNLTTATPITSLVAASALEQKTNRSINRIKPNKFHSRSRSQPWQANEMTQTGSLLHK